MEFGNLIHLINIKENNSYHSLKVRIDFIHYQFTCFLRQMLKIETILPK